MRLCARWEREGDGAGLAVVGVLKAKYLVHSKQEDGGWRWDKDIWNADQVPLSAR